MNLDVLKAIANATAASAVFYVSQADGLPLVQHNPPLITVDVNSKDPSDASKVAAKLTDAGAQLLASQGQNNEHTKPVHNYSVQSGGLVLPKTERKGFGGGAPTKYPFETMQVGDYFFVPNSDVEKGDAFKTMSSAVGSANQRFAEDVVENGVIKTKQVERAKRGPDHKAIKGPDGKNEKETVTVNEKRFTKKFVCRAVKKGVEYGNWTAPDDGAVITRVALPAA
jgi:hypothetical protein